MNQTHYELLASQMSEYRTVAKTLVTQMIAANNGAMPTVADTLRVARVALGLDRASENTQMRILTATMTEYFQALLRSLPNQYSLAMVLGTSQMDSYLKSALSADMTRESVLTTVVQHYHFSAHEFSGKRVYEVTAGLAEKLANTRLRGLTCGDLRLPFESIYIAIPPHANLRLFNMETGWHKAIGVYITEDKEHGDVRTLQYMVVGEIKEEITGVVNNNASTATLVIDDALFHFSLDLTDPARSIDAAISERKEEMEGLFRHYTTKGAKVEELTEEWRKVYEWTTNVLLYATWPDADVEHVQMNKDFRQLWNRIENLKARVPKNNPKLKDMRATLRTLDPRNRVILGRGVTLDSVREEMARNGGAMTVRIRVEGHWQHYWHGPKDGERIRIRQWKAPYWKGPEDAPTPETTTHVLM